jgi:hypothetical protein
VADGQHTAVAADTLIGQSSLLAKLATELRLHATELHGVLAIASAPALGAPASAVDAARRLNDAVGAVTRVANAAAALHNSVHGSAVRYEQAEQAAKHAAQVALHEVAQAGMWTLGVGVHFFGLPQLIGIGGALLLGEVITGVSPYDALQDFISGHEKLLTNPTAVAVIRELVNDLPDFAAGFLLLPPGLASAANDAGLTPPKSTAATIEGVGAPVGAFRETGEKVKKTSVFEFGKPASSLADRTQSFPIPSSDPNGEQIRIDRYSSPGEPDRFDVYIAGTQDFSPMPSGQPFDLTGDISGLAQGSPASYRAVVDAMHQAGVTSTSPVVLNGYSQGGLVAGLVASSGDFDVKGVVTFGAPASSLPVPQHIPVLALRNSEDLVPALGGYDADPHAVIVERPVFDSQPIPTDWAVPAHRLEYYEQTAAWADSSTDPRVADIRDLVDGFGAHATHVESSLWLATRT